MVIEMSVLDDLEKKKKKKEEKKIQPIEKEEENPFSKENVNHMVSQIQSPPILEEYISPPDISSTKVILIIGTFIAINLIVTTLYFIFFSNYGIGTWQYFP